MHGLCQAAAVASRRAIQYNAKRMEQQRTLRTLPSVDRLISEDRIRSLREAYSHETIVSLARQLLAQIRSAVSAGHACPPLDTIVEELHHRIVALATISPHPLINATGVIIHTNLGRAPLSRQAVEAMAAASAAYCNLEIDLPSGRRGSRNVHTEDMLCLLTGSQAALVVNNNASAVLLVLTALAKRKEVIVSRAHAVEIGGKFRIPDVMRQSGAKLVEVGTTNKTYISDYAEAITPRTAALLRVHSSNFRIVGFTQQATIEEMVQVGLSHDVPVFDDLGSGCLLDTTRFGLDPEPTPQESIAAGAGVAMFSGDKLLGGPQAGIIVGRKDLIERCKKHPLARAVRIDKTRLAALSATLAHYLKGEATEAIPIWRIIATPLPDIEMRARSWAGAIGRSASVHDSESAVGGGSLPGATLPTRVVSIPMSSSAKVMEAARRLRTQPLPVVGRVERNALLLDPRTVLPEQDESLLQSLTQVLGD